MQDEIFWKKTYKNTINLPSHSHVQDIQFGPYCVGIQKITLFKKKIVVS